MRSPLRTCANGPPIADSGVTCNTIVPKAVPLMRPSEMRTISLTPARANFMGIGMYPASGIPGAPLGPIFLSTKMSSAVTSKSELSIRLAKSAASSNTTARPSCSMSFSFAADCLMMAPPGAKLPCNTAILPRG